MQTTTNYGKFKTIQGNRVVKTSHVNNLANAIEKKNLLKVFPVIVNENMEVIDGQHRLLAAAKLGVKVPYEQIDGLRIEDVMTINTSSKGWTMIDYVKAYQQLGHPDYRELEDFAKKYSISVSISGLLLSGASNFGGGGKTAHRIKNGTFTINSRGRATKVAELLSELTPLCEFTPQQDRSLAEAVFALFNIDAFDPERLVSKMRKHYLKLQKRADSRYYIIHMEELYNHHAQDKVILYRGQ